MEKEIIAYKAFFKGLVNNLDNINYEIGKIYTVDRPLQYTKSGFHMCKDPEDCFKFLKPSKAQVDLTLVKGFGNMYEIDAGEHSTDDRLGYVYICQKMEILKVLTREEIIDIGLNLLGYRLEKFIEEFPLTKEEALLFKEKFKNEKDMRGNKTYPDLIDYYQNYHQKTLVKTKGGMYG